MYKKLILVLLFCSCATKSTIYNPEKHTIVEKLKYTGTVLENTNAKFTGHYLVVKDSVGQIDTIPVSPKIYKQAK